MVRDEIFDHMDAFTEEEDTELHPKLANQMVATKMELWSTSELGKISLCNQYIRTCLELDNGDIVQIGGQGYRNENMMFWSSTEGLLYPDSESGTDYGTVPSHFRVGNEEGEFSPWHWKEAIDDYDGTIWFSDSLRDEILHSLKEITYKSLPKEVIENPGNGSVFHTETIIHGRRMHILSGSAHPKHFQIIEENVIEGDE
jgi:hypothetical protein